MNALPHLKALQAQLSAARAAFDAGDREKALEHIDQALSIDPSFLAAHALRERVLGKPTALAPAPVPLAPPPTAPAKRFAAREAYERIELRAKQRRVDHCIAATRAALGRQQPEAAAAALAELIALEPDETNVASLSAELADLRRRFSRRPFGVRLAAASAFLAVAGTASWLELPRRQAPHARPATTVARTAPVARTVPVEDADNVPLESRAISIPVVRPPSTSPSSAVSTVAAAPIIVPTPTPIRPAPISPPIRQTPVRSTPSVAATAPLSLPVPLSQASAAVGPTREQPAAAVAAGAPAVIPAPAPVPSRTPNDRELVEDALQRYRRAYGRLNVQSAQAVYPTVNRVALARAFDNLESQALTFDSCDVEVRETLARAICHGTARYVPKVGSRYARTEPLVWSFELRKNESDWTIFYAKASR